jgi:hypothetical protein
LGKKEDVPGVYTIMDRLIKLPLTLKSPQPLNRKYLFSPRWERIEVRGDRI